MHPEELVEKTALPLVTATATLIAVPEAHSWSAAA
jgi:hypothetical protein